MAFTLSSLNLSSVAEDGGYELKITGSFEAGHRYRAFLGDIGNTSDPECFSGYPQQRWVNVWNGVTVRVWTPRVYPGLSSVTVLDIDTSESHTLVDYITVVYQQYRTTVVNMKKVFPLFYQVGIRDINLFPRI